MEGPLGSVRTLALLLVVLPAFAGCFGDDTDPRGTLVPYPRLGDVVVYDVSGSLIEFARWENGIPLAATTAQVRMTLAASPDAQDGARALHPVFKVTTEVAEAGVYSLRNERLVSPRHQAVVQSYHPLSQDQSVVAFDERGFPWLFGASVLIGEDLGLRETIPFTLPDNLGSGKTASFAWELADRDEGAHYRLVGEGIQGELWMEIGSPYPTRVELAITAPTHAPNLRSDGGYPVTMSARRASVTEGAGTLPPRDRGADFPPDTSATRTAWDGEKPPDGDATALLYPLSEAVRDAKLLDKPLADWLAAHDAPILYRATFQEEPGPLEGSTNAHWLLQFVDRDASYYEVQIARLHAPPLPVGIPRVESSAPAEAPASDAHGWFDPTSVPDTLVPISEAIRIVRDVFHATDVQLFLRSFTDPPGYSYFIDGGIEEGGVGRYTVVYNPNTGTLEQATGPVTPRVAE